MTVEPKIKGLAFIEALKWYADTHGDYTLRLAAKDIPGRFRLYITAPDSPTLGLLPGSWYPSEMVQLIFESLYRGKSGAQIQQLAADFSKASIGKTLSGFYATLMRMLASPELIATHFQKVWRLYQSTGDCKVVILGAGHHELHISDWAGHTPFFCSMAMFASRDVLEVIGCRQVTSSVLQCVAQGAPHCAYRLRWKV